MNKLFKLRDWLSLEEAAAQLSSALSEGVTVADILQLSLARRIKLSAYFVNHATALFGKLVAVANANLQLVPPLLSDKRNWPSHESYDPVGLDFPESGREQQLRWISDHEKLLEDRKVIITYAGQVHPDGEHVLEFECAIETLKGVWDLPMIGGERLDVEHRLQMELGGPEVTVCCLNGAFVQSVDGQSYAWIRERVPTQSKSKKRDPEHPPSWRDAADFYPAGGLPQDVQLVVRPAALVEFIDTLDQPRTRRSAAVNPRERANLLSIVAAMRKLLRSQDGGKFPSDAKIIELLVERHGQAEGVSKRNLEKLFAEASRDDEIDLIPKK